MLRVSFYEVPERLLVSYIFHTRELWLFRVPDVGCEVVAMRLCGQEVREQAVTQLVGEQPRDYLVAFNAGAVLRNYLIPGVDAYCEVVRAGGLAAFRLPAQPDAHAAIVAIPARLCDGHVLEVQREHARGEELPVAYLAALLIHEPPYKFVIHSRQESCLLSLFSSAWSKYGL